MTDINTPSNIVFTVSQKDVTIFLGINSLIITSLQTTGDAINTIIFQ